MSEKSNLTYLAIGGYIEINKYGYIYFFFALTLYIIIIISNSTIVYLIWANQNLHEPMYVFIAALSVNSLLYSTNIYPKVLMDSLSVRQTISYPACLFQYLIFYSLGGADFLVLSAMAFDRYVSICKPLLYPTIMRRRTVTALLLAAWCLPACQVAVPTAVSANQKLCDGILRGLFCNNAILKLHCSRSKVLTAFVMMGLVDLALLPAAFILFTYLRILMVSYRSSKDFRRKAAETCLPHLLVLICFSLLFAYDTLTAGRKISFPRVARLIMNVQVVFYSPVLNPIIYGVKMKEISKHMKKMFSNVTLK
ncbi:unnamed protein product [Ophioblennius macclurei]